MKNKEFFELVQEFRKNEKTWEEIRKYLLKIKFISNQTTWSDVRNKFQEMAARIVSGELDLCEKSEFEKACEKIDEFIGREFSAKVPKVIKQNPNRKILVLSDPHIPYCDYEKLWKAVKAGLEDGCDTLVINGDYLNGDRLSTHAKFKHESFQQELSEGTKVLEELTKLFDVVYLLDDNHVSDRWQRFLGNVIPPDLHFLLTHPYDYMTRGISNVIRAGQTHSQFPVELGHFMILGDAMFSHGFVSGKDGESARKVEAWYYKWRSTLELADAKVFLHGHSHCLTMNHSPDSVVIQTGTFASLEGLRYSLEGHLKSSPPVIGYTILEQFNGITDQSTIKLVKM